MVWGLVFVGITDMAFKIVSVSMLDSVKLLDVFSGTQQRVVFSQPLIKT